MNFFEPPAIVAQETQKPAPVSTEQINVPLDWIAGSVLGTLVLFFSVVSWVRGLSAKVENSAEILGELEKKLERERQDDQRQRKDMKNEIRESFKSDIAQSASDICHGFELFAMEMRGELKKLRENLDDRNATVNRLGKKVDHITAEMIGMAQQLQNQNIPIHYRRGYDNGPPSQPHNYDDD